MKGMMIGVIAALGITGIAEAAVTFFTSDVAFDQALADAGKTLKGIEDFDQALIPPFESALLSDPLDINNLQGLFKPGDFIDNLTFQSNTNGTVSVNDPGVNGLNPRGTDGLMLIGPGFAGAPNTGLLVNLAVDSLDILSGPPAGDNHTALGMHVFTTLQVFPTEVRVFDKSGLEVGFVSLPAVGVGGQFLGILATGGDTIGRVNIWNAGGGGEGVYDVQAYWLLPPPSNNDPSTPQPVNSGETISADFTGATSNGTSSCDPGTVDLFYEVTIAAGPATLDVDTCGSAADTALTIFDSSMTELACTTDCGGTPCGAPDACLSLSGLGADAYLIRVSQQTIAAGTPAGSFVLTVLVTPEAGPGASFAGLGDLSGGSFFSRAHGVSADGSVVVGDSDSASGFEGFRWTSGSGPVGLGDLPGGIFVSLAFAASADGSVVAGQSSSASGLEAFRWTSGPGMVGLGDLTGGIFSSLARGISGDGSLVVGESESASGSEAIRWTSGSGMVGLGDLPSGSFNSEALAVSADGLVIVGNGNSASGQEAFRWTSGGGMVGLGDLPGGVFASTSLDVSADGSVIVGRGNAASGFEAFRWTGGGGMVGLGDLPGGSFFSDALGVSADGSVIVGQSDSASGFEAFIWDQTNGMRSLRDVLVNDFGLGLELTGWTLTDAADISADGLTIVGTGTNPGGFIEAWIAILGGPCPADLSGDGVLGFEDLTLLLTSWVAGTTQGDIGGAGGCDAPDGVTDFFDLSCLLAAWAAGGCP